LSKSFIGPQLRQLRRDRNQTQAEMAKALGVSPAYINMLENNQRSLSVKVLMAVSEIYQVDWRKLVKDPPRNLLVDLRNTLQDPTFGNLVPDVQELRAAIDHAPRLVECFMKLHAAHSGTLDRIMRQDSSGAKEALLAQSPETLIHDFFRSQDNYFDGLEKAAEATRADTPCHPEDVFYVLKARLKDRHGVTVRTLPVEEMEALRLYDKAAREVLLSEALDFQNRVFQLAHVLALVEIPDLLAALTAQSGITSESGLARCQVELSNYFAAAFLMPYKEFRKAGQVTAYDVDRIAARFNCSYEQVCHRLTTMQRPGAKGVPFFFLRIDRAGNVSKRFNATSFHLAQFGGSCPVWNIHMAFRTPGEVLPQFVELPDGKRFFTLSRTADRPSPGPQVQAHRLTVAIGCEMQFAHLVGYAKAFNYQVPGLFSPIGINCHVCRRQACSQRAHQPLFVDLPMDPSKRGTTRYES
jgi:hypothetical protein